MASIRKLSFYGSTGDTTVKRNVLHSFMRSKDKDHLLAAAKIEKNDNLRIEAIHALGNIGAVAELNQLYASESSPEGRVTILDAMFNDNASDRLIELAKSEKDPKVRMAAIRRLGNMRRAKTAEALVSMYGTETDKTGKQVILEALFNQGSAKELVDVARKESDPELKKDAVRKLSNMRTKEANDFLAELLNK